MRSVRSLQSMARLRRPRSICANNGASSTFLSVRQRPGRGRADARGRSSPRRRLSSERRRVPGVTTPDGARVGWRSTRARSSACSQRGNRASHGAADRTNSAMASSIAAEREFRAAAVRTARASSCRAESAPPAPWHQARPTPRRRDQPPRQPGPGCVDRRAWGPARRPAERLACGPRPVASAHWAISRTKAGATSATSRRTALRHAHIHAVEGRGGVLDQVRAANRATRAPGRTLAIARATAGSTARSSRSGRTTRFDDRLANANQLTSWAPRITARSAAMR